MRYTVVPLSRTVPLGDTPIPNANTWSVEAQSCGPPGHCYCQGDVPLPRGPPPVGQSMTNGWLLWAQKSPVPWPQFRTTRRGIPALELPVGSMRHRWKPLLLPSPGLFSSLAACLRSTHKSYTENSSWPESVSRALGLIHVCFWNNVVRISSEAVKPLLHIKCSYQHQYPSVGSGSFSDFIIFQTECVSGSSDMSSVQLLTVFFRNGTLPVSCVSLVSDSLLTVSTQPGNVSDSAVAGGVWL